MRLVLVVALLAPLLQVRPAEACSCPGRPGVQVPVYGAVDVPLDVNVLSRWKSLFSL